MKTRKKLLLGTALLWILGLLLPLISFAPKAAAVTDSNYYPTTPGEITGATFDFQDRATIIGHFTKPDGTVVDVPFTDKSSTDGKYNYKVDKSVQPHWCNEGDVGGISFNNFNGSGPNDISWDNPASATVVTAKIDIRYRPANIASGNNDCPATPQSPNPPQPGKFLRGVSNASVIYNYYTWNNTDLTADTTSLSSQGVPKFNNFSPPLNYTNNPTGSPPDVMVTNSNATCPDAVISVVGGSQGTLFELSSSQGGGRFGAPKPDLHNYISSWPANTCYVSSINYSLETGTGDTLNCNNDCLAKKTFSITGTFGQTSSTGGGSTGPGGCASTDATCKNTASCVANGSTSLEWLLCPLITAISKAMDGFNNELQSQLSFSIKDFLPDTGSVHQAWDIIKNLISSVLVIILLVMVISQAIGKGPFEAYTIKKVLPRLVIAAVGMQISWEIAKLLIGWSNDLGNGIVQIMTAPFGGTGALDIGSLLNRLSSWFALGASVTLVAALVAAVWLSSVLVPGVLLVVFILFVAVVVALTTILFRNVLIVVCVIFMPLALLLWIMPSQTMQNAWTKYRDNFVKLLLLFPLFMSVIYAGRIFAWIAGGLGGGGGKLIEFIMILVGYFGPYFFLPKLWKYGGSWMAAGANAIATNKAVQKGREVGTKELGDWYKRRRDFAASEYTTQDSPATRLRNSLLGGRFLPTTRSMQTMIARGDEYKKTEAALKQATRERARTKEFSRTGDQMAGKKMDLDAITEFSEVAAKAALAGDTRGQKNAEMEAKEAMRDLIATGSTLELNNHKITDTDGKEKFVWQTKMWADLLNGSPELYSRVKAEAPDWVPHRTPVGLPGYRGEYSTMADRTVDGELIKGKGQDSDEWRQRQKMAADGMEQADIDAKIAENMATADFRRTGGGLEEHKDDVQWAASQLTTVEELDAQSLARLHPTYFERIGDTAAKGARLRDKAQAEITAAGDQRAAGTLTQAQYDEAEQTYHARMKVADELMKPSEEFGRVISNLARDPAGRQTLAVIKGGKDTMEHLDRALQYSGLPGTDRSAPKGKGSMDAVYNGAGMPADPATVYIDHDAVP